LVWRIQAQEGEAASHGGDGENQEEDTRTEMPVEGLQSSSRHARNAASFRELSGRWKFTPWMKKSRRRKRKEGSWWPILQRTGSGSFSAKGDVEDWAIGTLPPRRGRRHGSHSRENRGRKENPAGAPDDGEVGLWAIPTQENRPSWRQFPKRVRRSRRIHLTTLHPQIGIVEYLDFFD